MKLSKGTIKQLALLEDVLAPYIAALRSFL